MFCDHCGAENKDDAKFCKSCGKPLSHETNPVKPADPSQSVKKPVLKNAVIGIGVLAIMLTAIICIAINTGKTINLNNYLAVKTTGYDGYGTAKAAIDWTAIEEKYGDKLSFTNAAKNEYGGFLAAMTPIDVMKDKVSVKLEESHDLSNGTTIAYTWVVDGDLSNYIKGKVKYKDGAYTVTGLEKVGTFDAFADLEVEFSGVAPDGKASFTYTGSEMNRYDFSSDKISGLKNGDTITVTINHDKLKSYAENLGKIPEAMEKVYQVEGLDSYVSALSEIDEKALESMQQQAQDVYQAYVAKNWGEGETLESFTYIGNYLLTIKNRDTWGSNNILYLVYKAQVRNQYSNGYENYDQLNDIYWYISFRDLMLKADTAAEVDLTNYSTPNNRFTVDSGVNSGWWSTKSWYYYGYQTLDDLYKAAVTSNMDVYNHEDHVDENAALKTAASETLSSGTGDAGAFETEDSETPDSEITNGSIPAGRDYILPDSNTRLLTKADLDGLTAEECKLARNEIYARHGRTFKDQEIQAHFDACGWYEGTIEPEAFDESVLTETETANRNLIVEYEEEKGYN